MSLFYYKLKRNNYFVDEGEIINKSMALQRELNNKKNCHTVRTIPKSTRQIVETDGN